jgi:hypothetical protein
MLRKIVLVVLIFLAFLAAQEMNWQEVNSKIYGISNNYQKGKAREVMKAYAPAMESYIQSLRDSQELLANSKIGSEQILEILPYMIASSYRLAIATEKMVNGQMTYVFDQVERYKQAHELITQTIAQISNMRLDRQLEIPESMYGHLYYARGLVNCGMAYTLANGTLWQRYFIYMPSGIVQIMTSVESDLRHYLFLNQLAERGMIKENLRIFVSGIVENSNTDKTLKLSYYLETRAELETALGQRYENIFNVFDRYNNSKDIFRQTIEFKKYADFENNDVSKRLVDFIKSILDILKNN